MPPVVMSPRATRSSRRTPRALSTGAVLLGSSGALALSVPLVPAPAGTLLVSVVAVAGVVLLVGVPRIGAVALAGALGAAVPLLGAAVAGGRPGASTVAGGAALAVATVTSWRLRRRREWAPWYGTRGVVVASAAALAVLGIGVLRLADPGSGGTPGADEVMLTALGTVVPWSALVGATGWLRHPLAAAVLAPSAVQLAVVVAG